MEPRLFSRGNDEKPVPFPVGNGKASMEPRLFSRGNSHINQIILLCHVRFNGAAAFQPRK